MKGKGIWFCMFLLLLIGLTGCGKGKSITTEESFEPGKVSSIAIESDSWDIQIGKSADSNIHVGFKGSSKEERDSATARLQNGELAIQQSEPQKSFANQVTLGKAGTIKLDLPQDVSLPLKLVNGDGDFKVEDVSFSELTIENDSGYATLSNLLVDKLNVLTKSGDFKLLSGVYDQVKVVADSGYVTMSKVQAPRAEVSASSGEVAVTGIQESPDLAIRTGSGDITVSYQENPASLSFLVSSLSEDVTVRFKNASYTADVPARKEGMVGAGVNRLSVSSDGGTIVIR
ncbi:DUF4097 family beta strand repeat-containing protein [Gorillibacterium sp. CAU 1737]|uniref:DUF4097 family beta strand repeat-containing protein n=1 Tax=Gorillibacterium sp. CAU 1737 TaxID=3140362 RepID=UPI0032616B8D